MTQRLYGDLPEMTRSRNIAEISQTALASNYRALSSRVRRHSPGARMIAVVKADAYGHTNAICLPVLLGEGCDFFAVSSLSEAIAVRETADRLSVHPDILVLGYTFPEEAARLMQYDIIQTLLSLEYAQALSASALRSGVCVRTHVKVDSGMHRIGFDASSDGEIAIAATLPGLLPEGIFTHFARADECTAEGDAAAALQLSRFNALLSALEKKGITFPVRHAANSAAAIRFPEAALDAVRLGIMLYGVQPAKGFEGLTLRPVMRLRTLVAHIHRLSAGEALGYGGTYTSGRDLQIATLPIGYADGLLRAYGGATLTVETAEGDFPAPIVGRICMDQCMLDVTGIPVRVGDRVTVFGGTADALPHMAYTAGTIPYETLCGVSTRVPRIAVR